MLSSIKTIILGGGCFWCLEAVFQRCEGVTKVTSGYTDGEKNNPTYSEICTGSTGHAEVILVEYDESQVSLERLLEIFFMIHDPTTLNRQGNDQGTQYRSIICYQDNEEKLVIDKLVEKHQSAIESKIVTQICARTQFYPAEIEHQDYYERNSSQAYCQIVIKPKLDKLLGL